MYQAVIKKKFSDYLEILLLKKHNINYRITCKMTPNLHGILEIIMEHILICTFEVAS
jgi:peroxiredoxin family protein